MSERTMHAPAAGEDVWERVAFEVFAWEHDRRGASAEWICERWQTDSPEWRAKYFDLADRIAALLRAPRGEGEVWRDFLAALDDLETAANLWVEPDGPTAADVERLRQTRQRVIACARALAALRSESAARRGEGGSDGE